MRREVVALELLITSEQKAEPCELQGRRARACFLTVSFELQNLHEAQKIEIEKYSSYNKVMGTEVVALELLITFE